MFGGGLGYRGYRQFAFDVRSRPIRLRADAITREDYTNNDQGRGLNTTDDSSMSPSPQEASEGCEFILFLAHYIPHHFSLCLFLTRAWSAMATSPAE